MGSAYYGGVEFFKTIAEYGLVYADTHSSFISDRNYTPGPGEPEWWRPHWCSVRTNDLRNTAQDDLYLANSDFAANRVVLEGRIVSIADFTEDNIRKSVYYGVTDAFFEKYCGRFEDHSIVWFNSCDTSDQLYGAPEGEEPPPPLFKAFLDKNAGAVFGWDRSVSDVAAKRAGNYMFTRMLGNNDEFEPANPPIRPYGITDAFDGLQEKGYDRDDFITRREWQQPVLYFAPRDYGSQSSQEDVMLAPGITGLYPAPYDDEMDITGSFGDRTPTVSIGDSDLSIKEWDKNEITVELGDQDSGAVKVVVDDHDSNEVPLSQWKGEITVTGSMLPKGPRVEATMKFRTRADIHPFRAQPEDKAERYTGDEMPWYMATVFEEDSTCEYEFSGQFVVGEYLYQYSDGGTVNLTTGDEGGVPLYTGGLYLHPDAGTYEFTALATIKTTATKRKLPDGPLESEDVYVTFGTAPDMESDGTMTYYGDLNAGSVSRGGLTLEWQDIKPTSPPTNETPG